MVGIEEDMLKEDILPRELDALDITSSSVNDEINLSDRVYRNNCEYLSLHYGMQIVQK